MTTGEPSIVQAMREIASLKAQLTAAEQRAEQAENNATRAIEHCNKVLDATYEIESKLTASQAEVKRLREGIEEIVYAYSDYRAVVEQPHKLIADLKALLAQPSDGKEADDGKQ